MHLPKFTWGRTWRGSLNLACALVFLYYVHELVGSISSKANLAAVLVGAALFFAVLVVDAQHWLTLLRHGFAPLSTLLGAVSFFFWRDYGQGLELDSGFFQVAAQVLPVIILSAVVDVRASSSIDTRQLAVPLSVMIVGEIAALAVSAGESADAVNFALVCSAFVTGALALVLAVLADRSSDGT